jgi:spermidine synthase
MVNHSPMNSESKRFNQIIHIVFYLLFFLSGISGLVYEIIWMRKLSLIFGNTVYATSTVLTTFMGGLALGSYWFGRIADRKRNLIRLYFSIELGIGLSVFLLMFFFLRIMDSAYIWSYNTLQAGPLVLNIVRFILAIICLIIPTTLMGGTLPVISKLLVKNRKHLGFEVGNLYALNTLGGMVGCFITGFFLIKNLGEMAATLVAIAINVIVAFVILALGRFVLSNKDEKSKNNAKKNSKTATNLKSYESAVKVSEEKDINSLKPYSVLIIFGLGGFASLAYEVVWTRALLFFVSSRVYSFSIILTTFLFGIMLGSFIFAQIVDRLKRPYLNLGIIEIIIGLFALVTIPIIQHLQNFNIWMAERIGITSWTGTVFILFFTCVMVLFLPTFLMGAAFPLVNRIYVAELSNLGRKVGNVYSVNTVGAIIGSFLAGFVVMPLLGIVSSIIVLATLNVGIGIWATLLENQTRNIKRIGLVISACAVIVLCVGAWLSYTKNPIVASHPVFKGNQIEYYLDTPSGSLSVLKNVEEIGPWGRNIKFLNINGNNTAHTTFADIVVHKMLAHVPMLFHPSPKEVLIIGFGFGSTSNSVINYDDVDRVDCVELIAEERETAHFFLPENHGILENPRFNFIVNDGRNYLLVTDKMYDVISFNAIDPKMSPALYTRDFYELCKKRLKKDGFIAAWLPFYGLEPRENLSLIRSFLEVFPHTSLWYCNPEHYVLLGSAEPVSVDIDALKNRFELPNINQDLKEIHLNAFSSFLSTCIMDESGLRKMVEGVPLNTDLNPVVEFSRVSVARTFSELYRSLLDEIEVFPSIIRQSLNDQRDTLLVKEVERFGVNNTKLLNGLILYENSIWENDSRLKLESYGQIKNAIRQNLENDFNLIFFVDWIQHQDLSEALDLFRKAIEIEPRFAKACVFIGMTLLQQGEVDEAASMFRKALNINSEYVSANFNLGLTCELKQDWQGAIKSYEKVLTIQDNFYTHTRISNVYAYYGDLNKAIFHCRKALDLNPQNGPSYFNLGLFLEKQGRIKEAIRSFEKGLKFNPEDQKAKEQLQRLQKLIEQ